MSNNSFAQDRVSYNESIDLDQYRVAPPRTNQSKQRPLSANASVKLTKSNDFFKKTRIDSCSYVVVRNGIAQAIPFRPKPKQDENVPFVDKTENQ